MKIIEFYNVGIILSFIITIIYYTLKQKLLSELEYESKHILLMMFIGTLSSWLSVVSAIISTCRYIISDSKDRKEIKNIDIEYLKELKILMDRVFTMLEYL